MVEQQCLLLDRLQANIKSDLQDQEIDKFEKVVLVRSQLDDAKFLLDRVQEEIGFLQIKKTSKEKFTILNVKDFGAKGDGKSDDGGAIRNAIEKARQDNMLWRQRKP
jgi:hypothetical protein